MIEIKFLVTRIFVFLPSVPKRIKGLILYDKLSFGLRDIFCFLIPKKNPKKVKVFNFGYTEVSQLLTTIKGSRRAMCGLRGICWLLRNDSLLSEYKDGRMLISSVFLKCKYGNQYLLGIYFDSRGYWNASLYPITDSSTVKRNTNIDLIFIT